MPTVPLLPENASCCRRFNRAPLGENRPHEWRGAREVHMRISSPPIKYPDFYGITRRKKNHFWRLLTRWKKASSSASPAVIHSIEGVY
jgi:hypothetical protein